MLSLVSQTVPFGLCVALSWDLGSLTCMVWAQGLVTIQVNILSMYKQAQGLVTIQVNILSMYKLLVTIQVNILSMYKHICLYIDSIFTWIVTRPCGLSQLFPIPLLYGPVIVRKTVITKHLFFIILVGWN
jgi:hypothetical protein